MNGFIAALIALLKLLFGVPQPGPSPSPEPTPEPSPEFSAVARELLRLHNTERTSRGLSELSLQANLQAAAESHATWMARVGRMSHTGENRSSPWDRIREAGYRYAIASENVAWGYSDAADVTGGWMRSPGHRRNILTDGFRDAGFASAAGRDGRLYWCAVFGAPGSATYSGPLFDGLDKEMDNVSL